MLKMLTEFVQRLRSCTEQRVTLSKEQKKKKNSEYRAVFNLEKLPVCNTMALREIRTDDKQPQLLYTGTT